MILALYGSGAMGRDTRLIAGYDRNWSEIVFIDDIQTGELLGCPIYDFREFRRRFSPGEARFIIAVGEPRFRRETWEKMKRAGYEGAHVQHPSAFVAPDAEVGEGAYIAPGAYIGSRARIGVNLRACPNASIGHDVIIGDHASIGDGAFIGGHTTIGDGVHLGAVAALKDRISIGSDCVIAPGAGVFFDVPDRATVLGNPGRIVDEDRQEPIFAPSATSAAAIREKEKASVDSVAEKYWDVFSDIFDGIDFNPVSFRFRDAGWDSIRQMSLIASLEEAFGISLKGRDLLKINSYESGLRMIRKKLEQGEG